VAIGVTTNQGATAEGAAITVQQVQRILVRPLEAASIFLAMPGLQIFDTNGSPVRVPLQAPATAPTFIGENELIPEVNPVFGEVDLLPSNMKSIKVIVKFSNELARQSVVSLDSALQSRLVTDVATTLDTALIASAVTDGTSPTGILSYSGIQTMATVGAITIDTCLDAEQLLIDANANEANLRWYMRAATWKRLRKEKASTGGQYQLQPSPTAGTPRSLLGYPVVLTPRIPVTGGNLTKALLLDPTQIAVARDMTPSVRLLVERYAEYDQLALRVITRYDAKPLNPQAILRMDAITYP
jgi:HK97 family phage major capsid protein